MKKLLGNIVMTAELAVMAWAVASWLNVIANNTAPYGELAVWNLFTIIFG